MGTPARLSTIISYFNLLYPSIIWTLLFFLNSDHNLPPWNPNWFWITGFETLIKNQSIDIWFFFNNHIRNAANFLTPATYVHHAKKIYSPKSNMQTGKDSLNSPHFLFITVVKRQAVNEVHKSNKHVKKIVLHRYPYSPSLSFEHSSHVLFCIFIS